MNALFVSAEESEQTLNGALDHAKSLSKQLNDQVTLRDLSLRVMNYAEESEGKRRRG